MLKNPWIRLVVLGMMLVGSAIAFYLMSPLFVGANFATDGWPTLGYMPTRTPRPATATSVPTDTETPQPVSIETDFSLLEGEAALLLAQGEFYSVAHSGRGLVSLYQVRELGLVLGLEDFEVEDGPDLHVFLTSQDPVENRTGVELPDGLDLGVLKGLTGDQNYDLPDDIDLNKYKSVVIWCVPYQVPFAAAPLATP
jgi:hypothetical protein